MNEINNVNGNTEIPEVEELVIDDTDDVETIKSKVTEHNQKVKDRDDKIKADNAQLYARTKKAEGFELVDGKWVKPKTPAEKKQDDETTEKDGLSPKDVMTFINNKVPEEDIDDVVAYAKFKKISIAEALKDNVVTTLLADKAEKRATADGANTEGGRRGSGRLSDDALLANARKGIYPDSDEDIARLAILKRNGK